MPTAIESILWGMVTLSIVVVLHEAGHFVAAKMFGLKVHEFMVGLPGPKVSFMWRGTRFGLTAIPLGGYVKIAGMAGDQRNALIEPVLGLLTARGPLTTSEVDEYFAGADDDAVVALVTLQDWGVLTHSREDDRWASTFPAEALERRGGVAALVDSAREHTYGTLRHWQQLVVLSAGVAVNIASAFLVFLLVLALWGTPVEQRHVNVVDGFPAARAGVQDGDVPVAIGTEAVTSFDELIEAVGSYQIGDQVALTVQRGSDRLVLDVTTVENPETGRPMLGLERQFENGPMPLSNAATMAGGFVVQTAKMVFSLLSPSEAGETLEQSSSVVGISVAAAKAADRSPIDYASIVASLSLSLGLINILPVPPLDGGRIALTVWEAVSRRRVSPAVSAVVSAVGIVALLALMAFTMYNDISRLVG